MKFTLFEHITFEIRNPEALIEAYCFQSPFYEHYDMLLLRQTNRTFDDVRFIGARIRKNVRDKCADIIDREYKDFRMFNLDLDSFLDEKTVTPEERNDLIFKLAELARKLDNIDEVGFSRATKILHTRYPDIIPIIDNSLQKEYIKRIRRLPKGDWSLLFKDYYENFLKVKETYDNLCKIHKSLPSLGLTKVRIFDILWWSYLKAKNLKDKISKYKQINWTTIET